MQDIEQLRAELMAQIAGASDLEGLEAARIAALGKKGRLTELMKTLGELSPEARKERGRLFNALKDALAEALDKRKAALEAARIEARLERESVDVTLPARPEPSGSLHPIGQVTEELVAIFGEMGFKAVEGPDIEDDFHNFTALNIPAEHPARQMHDTFYLGPAEARAERKLLRTHTSPVQIRAMQAGKPPFRIIAPGRTYRRDSDLTHTPMFHQVEGLLVDRDVHMGHLKGCLVDFARTFFEVDDVPVRFRPSFFPFTEPSAEMDVACSREGGELKIGRGGQWLEILGCGMVHPKVLENVGLDPETWQGFAFGLGIERAAMLKYGISDLRTFFEADLRWLRHYGFDPLDVPSLLTGLSR